MPKSNFSAKRKEAATALRSLANVLSKFQVVADTGPLRSAAEQCSQQAAEGEKSWSYDIANLVFNLDAPGNTLPAKTKDFRIELSLSVAGLYDEDDDDQFTRLEMNLEKYAYTAGGAELKAAWHFDRHIINTDDDDAHTTDDIHPLYHFQYGGAKMSALAGALGSTLLLDPPRIMHPPMDGPLAVDFVLANYHGPTWKLLRDDAQYKKLIIAQIDRLWRPYYASVSNGWLNPRVGKGEFLCPYF